MHYSKINCTFRRRLYFFLLLDEFFEISNDYHCINKRKNWRKRLKFRFLKLLLSLSWSIEWKKWMKIIIFLTISKPTWRILPVWKPQHESWIKIIWPQPVYYVDIRERNPTQFSNMKLFNLIKSIDNWNFPVKRFLFLYSLLLFSSEKLFILKH